MRAITDISEMRLDLRLGIDKLQPAAVEIMRQLIEVQVQLDGEHGSGFQLHFRLDRDGDSAGALMALPELAPWSRVLLTPELRSAEAAVSVALIDGVITHHQYGFDRNSSDVRFIVSGRDLSILLDLVERDGSYRDRKIETMILDILGRDDYKPLGLTSDVQIPKDVAVLGWAQPHQSDLQYLRELALRCGCVFFMEPLNDQGQRRAYFGPLTYGPQAAAPLCLQLGPAGNVQSASFSLDAERPIRIEGHQWNGQVPEVLPPQEPEPPQHLAAQPIEPRRVRRLAGPFAHDATLAQTMAMAMATASKPPVTAQISLDTELYGAVLLPRQLVEVQGACPQYDGMYYVRSVTHSLTIGSGQHLQQVELAREGLGARHDAPGST